MTDKELVDKLRSTQSRSKRALLDAAADKIENQQNHIRALLQANEALRASQSHKSSCNSRLQTKEC